MPIRDLATVRGVRSNQLTGFGLVVGLHGTGDKSNFAKQQIQNLAKTIGLTVNANDLTTDNIAIAVVSATLPLCPGGADDRRPGRELRRRLQPPGARSCARRSRAPSGGDAVAVAQGPLVLGGFSASGSSASVTKNHTTAGSIPRGAMIESGVALARMRPVSEGNFIYLDLRRRRRRPPTGWRPRSTGSIRGPPSPSIRGRCGSRFPRIAARRAGSSQLSSPRSRI